MNFIHLSAAFSLLLSVSSVFSLQAQNLKTQQEISIWYLEERFLIADYNDDALLETSELKKFPEEFTYYLKPRNFEASDRNKDGYLSFNEIKARRNSEKIYRYNMERKEYRELTRSYPILAQADIRYLKDRPGLVARLFGNLSWMYEHAALAERLYNDRSWTARNPEVLIALHKNLRWMVSNPVEARGMYRDRNTTQHLPQLLSWRADHQAFLRKFPKLDPFYQLDFFPENIILGDR